MKRRKFIQGTFMGSLSSLVPWAAQSASHVSNFVTNGQLPLVVATWDNRQATRSAMNTLLKGGSPLDAVEAGARIPEGDPADTSVGYGGLPDREGNVTLDACIMDSRGNAGSVTYLQHIKHPVSVARKVMELTPHVMLSGEGALQFALANGFKKENLLTDHAREIWEKWKTENNYHPRNHDTIGILALDAAGNLAGACTTSGLAFKMAGRVGDSPIPGAGMYVDNEVGAAAATGNGELVMKTVGSFLVVELMRLKNPPDVACRIAIERIIKRYRESFVDDVQVSYVAANKDGVVGGYSSGRGFQIAVSDKDKDFLVVPDYYFK